MESMKKKACVASGHKEVTRAALTILEQGGNAFDAAIGAGFVSSVAEPALTSLGGGGFLLARTSEGKTTLFDFFVNTPGLGGQRDLSPHFFPVTVEFPGCTQDFNVGMGSCAVPGNIKGFLHVQKHLGRLPLTEVLKPAIEIARKGIPLNGKQAYFLSLLRPIMTLFKEGEEIFSPNGSYLREGDIFKNPDLADFLEALAQEGEALFYSEIAAKIDQDMAEGQGLLTKEDLEKYQVIERRPLTARYRGYDFITNPPPSFGGWLIAQGLNCIEAIPLGDIQFGGRQHLEAMAHFLREWEGLRVNCPEDPECPQVEETRKYLRRLFSRGTTHLSILDHEGNAASMTTSNGEGSGYIVPGTGIMLNNMMGEDDLHPEGFHASPPGIRVSSMMAPSMITRDGNLYYVLGSGGSKRIRSAILEVTSYCIDFGLSIREAVDAPRIHYENNVLQIEPGFSKEVISGLEDEFEVNVWDTIDVYFGGVHAIDAQRLEAKADQRRGGHEECR